MSNAFFGRVKKLWEICSKPYRFDLENFDDDVDLCFLLTNESIVYSNLVEKDLHFYKKKMSESIQKNIEKIEKRKQQKKNYINRKKQRIEALVDIQSI